MTSHLTSGQRAMMEAALTTRQRQLDAQIAQHLGGGSRAEHAREVLLQDGDDAPARDADREVDLARSDQDIAELRAVNEALARVHSPEFGRCIDCDAEIPFDRLQRNPQVTRCIGCQSAFETRHGAARRATL
jgi:DnaK suppressor protein